METIRITKKNNNKLSDLLQYKEEIISQRLRLPYLVETVAINNI